VATTAANEAEQADSSGDGHGQRGARRRMGLDVAVYIDGRVASILRYGELPPIPSIQLDSGVKQYKLIDYLQAIGVQPSRIRAVHLHGNNDRIASLKGSEITRDPQRFRFQFLSGTTGIPVTRWSTSGLTNEFTVHEIRAISVFVNKPPAPINTKLNCHTNTDGECTHDIPYFTGSPLRGTRIYAGRNIAAWINRRSVEAMFATAPDSEASDPEKTPAHHSLFHVFKYSHIDIPQILYVDFIADDEVVARADANQLTSMESQLWFTLPHQQHGVALMHLPGSLRTSVASPGSNADVLVHAVRVVYQNNFEPSRISLTPVSAPRSSPRDSSNPNTEFPRFASALAFQTNQ